MSKEKYHRSPPNWRHLSAVALHLTTKRLELCDGETVDPEVLDTAVTRSDELSMLKHPMRGRQSPSRSDLFRLMTIAQDRAILEVELKQANPQPISEGAV